MNTPNRPAAPRQGAVVSGAPRLREVRHAQLARGLWGRPLSRRDFVLEMGGLAAATTAFLAVGDRWVDAARAADIDLVHDTLNGLVAFVVPGPDDYSLHQGVSTTEPGGIAASCTDALIVTLDGLTPFVPSFSATAASILNDVAQQVDPAATGPFQSAFARLSFAEKVYVIAAMDGTDPLKPLAGFLPAIIGFLSYSEAGVFDPKTMRLAAQPVGWQLSGYEGVAEGRSEFHGYFQDRRTVEG
jgi:hypothetical protein